MGILDDILEAVTGVEEKIRPTVRALATPEKFLFRAGGGGFPEREEPALDDALAAILRGKAEDVLSLGRGVQTPDDLATFEAAQEDLAAFAANLPNLREQTKLLEGLPEFTEDTTAEQIISAVTAATPSLEEEGLAALTPEDQAFADLQTRGLTLDVELKEQELASVKTANQQAGMMSLLNMLPADSRSGVIATIMETPTLRDQLFPGLFGGGGGGAVPSATGSGGDVIDILTQFGGG